MKRIETLKDFFARWPGVSKSRFATDASVHRNTLTRALAENRNISDKAWPRIAVALHRYGYPAKKIPGTKTAITTKATLNDIQRQLEKGKSIEVAYQIGPIPAYLPDQATTWQTSARIAWEEPRQPQRAVLVQMLQEQLEMDTEGFLEHDVQAEPYKRIPFIILKFTKL